MVTFDAQEASIPEGKRVPFGWKAASISRNHMLRLFWSEEGHHAEQAWLRITVALDMREETVIEARTAVTGKLLGSLDIRYSSALHVFQLLLSSDQAVLAIAEGIELKQTEGNSPLWILVDAVNKEEASLLLPHLQYASYGEEIDSWQAMGDGLATLSSVQPFGWMEGCVLDGLMELGSVTGKLQYHRAVERHLSFFFDERDELKYENPRSEPVDGIIYGIEGTLPFAMLARLDAHHPSIQQTIDFWQKHRQEDGTLLDGTMLSAEGSYTIAYPMAVIAKRLARKDLAELAIRQLEVRQERLVVGNDLYLRYYQDGSFTFRHWSRAYAWYLLGLARTIKELDGARELLDVQSLNRIDSLKQEWVRISRIALNYQLPSGMWAVFLDDPDTGEEASGTAGIATALAIGANMGILAEEALVAAKRAQAAITDYLTPDGILSGVSQGNKNGEQLQRCGYRILSLMGTGLAAQLWAELQNLKQQGIRYWRVPNRWCLHSYYTISPYAPDQSGRMLIAAVDVESGEGEVLVLSRDGEVLNRFGRQPVKDTGFYHTGFWQTWSADTKYVYYQKGTWSSPQMVKYELASGEESVIDGDMQGAPPFGEPIISGLSGMLQACNSNGVYSPELAPMPFQDRGKHGLFQYSFMTGQEELVLSVEQVLKNHPYREKLLASEQELKVRLGRDEGLSLMLYCVRWSPKGDRFLFFFGNHNVVPARGEPRLGYVFTADRDLSEIHLAVDLSYGKPGLHWSWHPDGERLIGYGPDPEDESQMCLAMVRFDGSEYKKVSSHHSGGHPSVSPVDWNLFVTDSYDDYGELAFIDIRTDTIVRQIRLPRKYGENPQKGRNRHWVDLHPVFSPDGRHVLVNCFQEGLSVLAEVNVYA